MSENTEANGTTPPTVEVPKKAKKAKPEKRVEGEREFKIVHLDTADEAEFKRLKLPKDEEDPHWDHRMTMDVPEKLIESMVERQLPTAVQVEEGPDGSYLIDDGRTRVRAIPEVNRRRKKLGKPPFVLTVAVGKSREKSVEGDREVVMSAMQANIRLDDPPTVQAMHISRALAADVDEATICRMTGHTSKKLHEMLALLDLPKKVQAHVDDGTISIAAALALTKLDEKDVEAAAEKLAAAAKLGKKVSAASIAPKSGDDKVATKKEIKQFALNLSSDPFAGKHGEAVTKAIILGIELCMGLRSIPQATAAGSRVAKGDAVKIDFKQFQTDGKDK